MALLHVKKTSSNTSEGVNKFVNDRNILLEYSFVLISFSDNQHRDLQSWLCSYFFTLEIRWLTFEQALIHFQKILQISKNFYERLLRVLAKLTDFVHMLIPAFDKTLLQKHEIFLKISTIFRNNLCQLRYFVLNLWFVGNFLLNGCQFSGNQLHVEKIFRFFHCLLENTETLLQLPKQTTIKNICLFELYLLFSILFNLSDEIVERKIKVINFYLTEPESAQSVNLKLRD